MAWDLPSRVPMMISVPGESGARIMNSYTELVDLMPTLTDLAMGLKLQACPKNARAARARSLCTDGEYSRPHRAGQRNWQIRLKFIGVLSLS